MEKTPTGTSVGVTDPYDHVERCDHVTDDGRCRYAFERFESDPTFATAIRDADYHCPVVDSAPVHAAILDRFGLDEDADSECTWADCPRFRSRSVAHACCRCGLEEHRDGIGPDRPLLEKHHLSYAARGRELRHEITVTLCRWCHAKIHNSWARIDDDVNPVPEAIAEREGRRTRELAEGEFKTAAERYQSDH